LIILGIILTAGGGPDGQAHGFEFWRNPGLSPYQCSWIGHMDELTCFDCCLQVPLSNIKTSQAHWVSAVFPYPTASRGLSLMCPHF
jgi:amino acid permease